MQVLNIRVDTDNERCRLSADVHFDTHWVWGDEPFHLWYEYPTEFAAFISAENADLFIPALLSSAMFLGEPLIISDKAAISQQLYSAIPRIQDIYHCWDPKHSRVDVEAEIRSPTDLSKPIGHSALFYSLGVDSNYTLAKALDGDLHRGELPRLIMIEGFDVYLWERHRFPPMYEAAAQLAGQLGTEVLAVTTNLRELGDRVTDWVRYFHGPALASTVLALGSYFKSVRIAASQTYRCLIPRGAHPLLDPLWGTEWCRFEHDGLEATRLEKLRAIALMPLLVKNLRVCATGELTEAYNCGRCEKCLRTMIGLHIVGALELCETLPHKIELDDIRNLQADNDVAVDNLDELVSYLQASDSDAKIAATLRERIANYRSQPDRG